MGWVSKKTANSKTIFASALRGYHVYRDVWKPSIWEKLVAKREFNNPMDKHDVKFVKGDETVGHLPHKFCQIWIAWYFLGRSGKISVEVIGRTQLDIVSSCAEEWRFHAN